MCERYTDCERVVKGKKGFVPGQKKISRGRRRRTPLFFYLAPIVHSVPFPFSLFHFLPLLFSSLLIPFAPTVHVC